MESRGSGSISLTVLGGGGVLICVWGFGALPRGRGMLMMPGSKYMAMAGIDLMGGDGCTCIEETLDQWFPN